MRTTQSSKNHEPWDFDCAIIGSGPGGLVTALYLRRFCRTVGLFRSGKPRISWGSRIHNLIGHPAGISGKELLRRLNIQLAQLEKVETIQQGATLHRRPGGGFEVECVDGSRYSARTAVIATGLQDIQPDIQNLDELRRKGLLKYCSICDGFELRHKSMAVLVQDDYGIQKALFLTNWTRSATLYISGKMKLAPQRIRELRRLKLKVIRYRSIQMKARRAKQGLTIRVDRRSNTALLTLSWDAPDRMPPSVT